MQALSGLSQRIREARATVLRFAEGAVDANPRKHARAEKALKKVERRLEAINREYGRQWRPDVVGAFVVFNCEEVCGSDLRLSLAWGATSSCVLAVARTVSRGLRVVCLVSGRPTAIQESKRREAVSHPRDKSC